MKNLIHISKHTLEAYFSVIRQALKHYSYLTLISLIALLCYQCEKKASGDKAVVGIQAKLNGVDWSATNAGANIAINKLAISGIANDGSRIRFNLESSSKNKYTFTTKQSNTATHTSSANSANSYYSYLNKNTAGDLVITNIDHENKLVSGTFECDLVHSITGVKLAITEGKFMVPLDESSMLNINMFSSKVNKNTWHTHTINGGVGNGVLMINATNEDVTKIINLSMPADITVGEYPLTKEANLGSAVAKYYPIPSTCYISNSGTLKITQHNIETKHIEGTFNFSASNYNTNEEGNAELTEGEFSVFYQ